MDFLFSECGNTAGETARTCQRKSASAVSLYKEKSTNRNPELFRGCISFIPADWSALS